MALVPSAGPQFFTQTGDLAAVPLPFGAYTHSVVLVFPSRGINALKLSFGFSRQ